MGGEALIEFPQRGGTTRWLRWVARPPCKERGGDRCDATGSQAVATRALLPLGTAGSHGGGQRSVGHSIWAVSSERAGQGSVCEALSLFLFPPARTRVCLYFSAMFTLLSSPAEPSTLPLSGACDRPIKAAWGALPFLIPRHSQINRVSVSAAVWPLSHFKSGPFGLFDLTSISRVIDSPRDLFFSPHI